MMIYHVPLIFTILCDGGLENFVFGVLSRIDSEKAIKTRDKME